MRKFNYRVLFSIFITMLLSMLLSRQIFSANLVYIFACVLGLVVLLVLCLKYKCINRFIVIIVVFILSVSYFGLSEMYSKPKIITEKVAVSGVVCYLNEFDNYNNIIINNVKINNKTCNKSISLNLNKNVKVDLGYLLNFDGTLETQYNFNLKELNSFVYKHNIGYYAKAVASTVITTFKNKSLKDTIRSKFTFSNMNPEIAGLITAVLFGDKTGLDTDIRDTFSFTGTGHLLAVSGLHVGLIAASILFVLKKLKVKNKISLLILTCILIAYCYLCNFSPSVIRAVIMSITVAFALAVGRQHDALNALAVSGIIVLCINPISVFDIGFQLSYACVFCLFCLNKFFYKKFYKLNLPKFLASGLAAGCAVQIGMLPLTAYYFDSFNFITIPLNVLAVPLFELCFTLTLVIVPLAMLIPVLGFSLRFLEFMYTLFVNLINVFAGMTWASVNVSNSAALVTIGYFIVLFFCSAKINVNKSIKLVVTCFILCAAFLLSGFATLPTNSKLTSIGYFTNNNSNVIVVRQDNLTFCIGDLENERYLQKYLKLIKVKQIDYFILTKQKQNTENYVKIDTLITQQQNVNGFLQYNNILLADNTWCYGGNAEIFYFKTEKALLGITVNFKDFNLFYATKTTALTEKEKSGFKFFIDSNQLYLAGNNSAVKKFLPLREYNAVLTNRTVEYNNSRLYLNNWTFNLVNDNIKNIRSLD